MKIQSGTLVLAVFAVLFGLAGAYVAKQQMAAPAAVPPAVAQAEERVGVPVAAVDLPAGRTITTTDLIVRQLTWQQIRDQGLPREFMNQVSQLAGRRLRADRAKGSPFTPDDLYPEGTGPNVAERLQPGYRAVPVALDGGAAELHLLSPGAMVDVMFRTHSSGALPETTVTLLEDVEVLAVGEEIFPGGRNSGSGGRRAPAVTLSCTPGQAAALKVVEGRGTISLVLRNPDDRFNASSPAPRTLESLLELPEPPEPFTTEIYRRGRVTTTVFENGRPVAVEEGLSRLPVPPDASPAVPGESEVSGMPSVLRPRAAEDRQAVLRSPGGETESDCDGCGE